MSTGASYAVARSGAAVFIRATGLANMKNAPILDAFLDGEIRQGAKRVCLDLHGCTGMDSTFMGMMVGYAKQMELAAGRLIIVNPGERNLALLSMLGVTEVVPVITACNEPDLAWVDLTSNPDLTPLQRMQLIKQAHEHLIKLSDSNQAKFAPFLSALEKDLQRFAKPS